MSYKEGVRREPPHGTRIESSFFRAFDPEEWESGRYKAILDMVRQGCCNEEIMDKWTGVDESLCEVYRKIVAGTTANMGGNGAQKAMSPGARRRLYMLELSAAGMSAEQIAERVGCSLYTVREAIYGSRTRGRTE